MESKEQSLLDKPVEQLTKEEILPSLFEQFEEMQDSLSPAKAREKAAQIAKLAPKQYKEALQAIKCSFGEWNPRLYYKIIQKLGENNGITKEIDTIKRMEKEYLEIVYNELENLLNLKKEEVPIKIFNQA
jgi:hypothetical protein